MKNLYNKEINWQQRFGLEEEFLSGTRLQKLRLFSRQMNIPRAIGIKFRCAGA